MLMKSGFFLLLVTVLQVSSEYVEPDFIENVNKGESSSRIVSGWVALPGQHPHQAALRMVDSNGGVGGCGGSIVSKEWVITAAHCVAGRITVVVRGGAVSLTNPQYIFETTEWYNYPTYNDLAPGVVQINDISIVKLQRPVVYSRLLNRIRVQSTAEAHRNYDGEVVYTSGHGRTWTNGATSEDLNWVYLRTIANTACAQTFGSTLIVDSSICASWFNVTSQSPCSGDSGGPLVHVGSDGVPTLIGVTSFVAGGNFGCHSGLPAGFIRPGPFLPWFKEITGIDFENLQEDDEEVTEAPGDSEEDDVTDAPDEDEDVATEAPDDTDEDGEDTATEAPGDGEEEEDEEEDSDSSESNEDDEMSELLKRLEVKVKVKVRFNKYKVKKVAKKEKEIRKTQ